MKAGLVHVEMLEGKHAEGMDYVDVGHLFDVAMCWPRLSRRPVVQSAQNGV